MCMGQQEVYVVEPGTWHCDKDQIYQTATRCTRDLLKAASILKKLIKCNMQFKISSWSELLVSAEKKVCFK